MDISPGYVRSIALRDVSHGDLDEIDRWGRAIDYERFMSRLSPFCYDGTLEGLDDDYVWFVITTTRGTDVGTVWIERKPFQKEIGVLGILLAHPDLFGRHIGRLAIRRAIAEASRRLGVRLVRLHVRRTNRRAISCYQHCGLDITGTAEASFADGRRIPFHRMELDLDHVHVLPARSGSASGLVLPQELGRASGK